MKNRDYTPGQPSNQPLMIRSLQVISIVLILFVIALVFLAASLGRPEMYQSISIASLVPLIGFATCLIPVSYFAQRLVFLRIINRHGAVALKSAYASSLIIGNILREVIALCGFIASYLSRDPSWATGFGVVAITLISLNWPSVEKAEKLTN